MSSIRTSSTLVRTRNCPKVLLDEPELCTKSQGGNRQIIESWLYLVGEAGNVAKPDHGDAQEKWENSDICGLLEVECSHNNDVFSLPFTDIVLDALAGHEVYIFLDSFGGYNQIRMHPDDQEKTTFVKE